MINHASCAIGSTLVQDSDLPTLVEMLKTHLIQSEKMSSLGQRVAGIARAINNPINLVRGNLVCTHHYAKDLLRLISLYEEEYPEPTLRIQDLREEIDLDFLKEDFPNSQNSLVLGAERIQEISVSLRTFSRSNSLPEREVDIHDGIESTLMILQGRFKAFAQKLAPGSPGLRIVKSYGDLPSIECYAGQLNQVFMNLLSNALDALEEVPADGERVPTISIETYPLCRSPLSDKPDWVGIKISDNGAGIAREVIEKLFEPFFTTKPMGKGTGLGLSISHQIIVERHRGLMSCNSELGSGTEFVLELPVQC